MSISSPNLLGCSGKARSDYQYSPCCKACGKTLEGFSNIHTAKFCGRKCQWAFKACKKHGVSARKLLSQYEERKKPNIVKPGDVDVNIA